MKGKYVRYSQEKINQVTALKAKGLTLKEIAKKTGMKLYSVQYYSQNKSKKPKNKVTNSVVTTQSRPAKTVTKNEAIAVAMYWLERAFRSTESN